jgi:hypothetical protein
MILNKPQKRFFDPQSKKDMMVAKMFFKSHTWGDGGCPFFLEFPYSTVPDMMKDKIIHKAFAMTFDKFHHVYGDNHESGN